MHYYRENTETVLEQLKVTSKGLTTREVSERLARYGTNVLRVKGEPLWRIILEPFLNVFIAVLAAAAILSIATGHALDAVIIGSIIFISAAIYYVQRFSTDRVLRALKKHDTQTIMVRRNGNDVEVDSEQLVPGDIINIAEGEKVPADGRVIHAENIRADEAMLTGESEPVSKFSKALADDKKVYEQNNMLFQGSYVVSGRATMVVTATGSQTEFGRLATLAAPTAIHSPAQAKIDRLVTKMIIAIFVVVSIAFGIALWRGMEFFETLRFIMSLAVSAVPEGLPVAITVILVLGMRRLAKYKALARSMKAIENVGIITTIASDKTGTLTKNKLSVQDSWTGKEGETSFPTWILLAGIANNGGKGDPLDTAMHEYAAHHQAGVPRGRTLVTSVPFEQAQAMSGNVWQVGERYELVVKGAPEKIIQQTLTGDDKRRQEADEQLHRFTAQGFRVIALAHAEHLKAPPSDFSGDVLSKLQFIGFIAVADELRKEAKQAIADAQSAGITVRMITGDHAETAFAIGRQLGLVEHRHQVLDCRTLGDGAEAELERRVEDTRVFARVLPEMKYQILSVLKKTEIAAMTGDGVNDVPALTNAHIGVAMGSGSQIAKEAGDIVLLDDNFATIVKAVERGRIIFDNIRRMLFYLLATSLGEVTFMTIALLAGVPLPLVAVQILWINLVTDTSLVIPLGLEPAEEDVMKRPPRPAKQPILERHVITRVIIVALTMALTSMALFVYYLPQVGLDVARTIVFSSLVVMQWANALNARSEWSSILIRARVVNKPMIAGFALAFGLQLLVMFGPLQAALHVAPDTRLLDVVVSGVLAATAVILSAELHKAWGRRGR